MIAGTSLETLTRALAPETADLPIYAVLQSDHPSPELIPGWASGCAGTTLDLAFENWLRLRRRWQGRGAAFYVADSDVARDASELAQDDPELNRTLAEQRLHVLALHEIAHLAEDQFAFCYPTLRNVATPAVIHEQHVAWCQQSAAPVEPSPMATHGWRWVRAFLHLIGRYQRVTGTRLPLSLIDLTPYALSPAAWYASILAAECREMHNATFAEIQRTPAPVDFLDLFNADTALFHASRLPWQIALRSTRTTNYTHHN